MAEEWEQLIKNYQTKRPELDYLDLAFPESELKKLGKIEFYCFKDGYHHEYHSKEHKQQNFLSDCQTSQLQNQHAIFDRLTLFSRVSIKHHYHIKETLQKQTLEIQKLQKSLEQRDTEILNLRKLLLKLPTKVEVNELINSVFDQPKKIEAEAIKLSNKLDQKIDRIEELTKHLIKHTIGE